MNVAVVLAAGTGKRSGLDYPKQFALMDDGMTVLAHSVRAFASVQQIDKIIVVAHKDWMDKTRQVLTAYDCEVIEGGAERSDSSVHALRHVADEDNVLIHDAARPYVSEEIIIRCLNALQTHEACAVGIQSTDTIWVSSGEGTIEAIPERSKMVQAQTPQCFRGAVIKHAYALAKQDPTFKATDDCGVVMRYMPQVSILIVEGSPLNRKMTYRSDF